MKTGDIIRYVGAVSTGEFRALGTISRMGLIIDIRPMGSYGSKRFGVLWNDGKYECVPEYRLELT